MTRLQALRKMKSAYQDQILEGGIPYGWRIDNINGWWEEILQYYPDQVEECCRLLMEDKAND